MAERNPSKRKQRELPPTAGDRPSQPDSAASAEGDAPTTESAAPQPAPPYFPIVGIGASAGGLAAFEEFFSGMPVPTDIGIAFLLVQHLSPDHKSIMADLVRRYTPMQVYEAEDGMEVRPNCVYIIPPNHDMGLSGARLVLSEFAEGRGLRLPIDHLFRSLASEHRERAICIVCSGTGSDGALGVRSIKGEGGMAMVQSPESAEHEGMPRSAIATGLVDYVLPPEAMGKQLTAYVRHAFGGAPRAPARANARDLARRICVLLRAQTGHDFSQYKETTLLRRLERRMALHQIEGGEDYLAYARKNPVELDALFADLLIGVTNFFRDPEAFKLLETQVIPRLLEDKNIRTPVRIWVWGCSTGEEAYSIAILFKEVMETLRRTFKIQIFATDIDRNAIDRARTGVYPASICADVSAERLARYFIQDADTGTYRIQKFIRDTLVFSEQDVVKDPPFSKLDLVSCRNLLIYLNADAQKKLIPLFHYALRPGGTMFLGPSETVGESAPLFQVVDRKWKLFTRPLGDTPAHLPSLPKFEPTPHERHHPPRTIAASAAEDERNNLRQVTEQALLSHFPQVAVLINARGEILHIIGRSGLFLEPPDGDASMNVLTMAREGLRRELTVAVHKAVAMKQPVAYRGLRVRSNGHHTITNIVVRPANASTGGSDLYLVILEESTARDAEKGGTKMPAEARGGGRIAELESELRAKDEYLQTTLEEMATTNEELESTNEEMQSVNEELQSTNEELETSKEELQSVNEELSTVNAELQDKVADLSRVNHDMNNLLAGTGVGTVFIDHSLRIVRFTPAATQVINLIASDVGRPIDHVATNIVAYDRLTADIENVLATLAPFEAEVQVKSGAWYLMRIRPYPTRENVIEGVVLTLVDISARKRAEASLRESESRFHAVVSQAYAAVAEMDLAGRFTFVNSHFCSVLGYSREELLQKHVQEITHPEDRARNAVQWAALVAGGTDFHIDRRCLRRDGASVWMSTRFSGIRSGNGTPRSLVSISFDMTERKRLETEITRIDAQLASAMDALTRLHAVSTLYVGASSLQAVLDEVVAAAVAISGADMGTLQLFDEAGSLKVVAHSGFDAPFIEYQDKTNGKAGAAWAALQRRERVVVPNASESPAYAGKPLLHVLHDAGVRALQSTPLIGRYEALLGVVTTHYRKTHEPPVRSLQLLDLLARQTAEVVERARTDLGRKAGA